VSAEAFRVDLTNCDREPIHIPGATQPHGVLLACHGDALVVRQVSQSVVAHLGLQPQQVLGRALPSLLSPGAAARLVEAARAELLREGNPVPVEVATGAAFDALLHRPPGADGVVVVELEPRYERGLGFHPRMRASVTRLQGTTDVLELCQVAAEEVRVLTGFDRVMVYRFDREWNGEVIAEARRDDLEPFLGLHYPASDIPAQARRLYTLNWLRLIVDVGYAPSPLVPPLDPASGAPLDLSFSSLRSVSPIHIEYLRNMGVTASMSISLMQDGRLAGLVACHHYTGPKTVPFSVRETCEFLGQALSWHVSVREASLLVERRRAAQRLESVVVASMAAASDFVDGLAVDVLPAVTESRGAAVVFDGRVVTVGAAPDEARVREIVRWLQGHGGDVVVTDRLSSMLPPAEAWDDTAAGLLAVPIARTQGDYVLWFRPATDQEVRWAGDPRKQVTVTDGVARLSPRGSFALWCEQVRGRSAPWEDWQVEAAVSLRRGILEGVSRRAVELRILNAALLASDRAKDEFIATVSHELRTPINAVLGWAKMLRSGRLSEDKRERALETVERNARAQVDLIEDVLEVSQIVAGKLRLQVGPVEMISVVEAALDTVRPAADARGVRLQPVLDPHTNGLFGDPGRLQQIVWNLLSNAVKCTPKGGRVYVRLQQLDSSVELAVTDTGQGIAPEFLPHVFERFRQADGGSTRSYGGLGLGLAIVKHLTELHGGTITAQSEGLGLGSTFTLTLPVSPVRATPVDRDRGSADGLDCMPDVQGLRVLVLDDEGDARDLVREMLEQGGARVSTAATVAEALSRVVAERPDVAVSDIGMPGEDGYAFIRQLRSLSAERGGRTPAAALTAYARAEDRTRSLAAGFDQHVAKPVDARELLTVVASLAGRFSRP